MSVSIKEIAPSEMLSNYIVAYREGTFNTYALSLLSQKVVPHGYIDLIIHLSDSHCELIYDKKWRYTSDFIIIGLWTQPYNVRFSHKVDVFWIRFKPEALYELFALPASEFGNSQADIEDLLGKDFRDFCWRVRDERSTEMRIELAEHYLKKQLLKNSKTFSNYVQMAADVIRKEHYAISIDELSDMVCISPRQLEREFKSKIGISPKMYMRIARLGEVHRLLGEKQPVNFSNISYNCGYADQAHFVRDFKRLTGEAPTAFLNDRGQYIVS